MHTRSEWIDYAKGIGIILVVYGHVARGLHSAGIPMPFYVFGILDSVIYSFHMPLFFFLSGLFFVDSFERRGSSSFWRNKVDTVFYPYLLWSLIQGSIEFLLSRYTNGTVSLDQVFGLLWAPRAQFWFLYVLFLSFIICAGIFSYLSIRYLIVIFTFSAFVYIFSSLFSFSQIAQLIAENFVFFIFGIVYSQHFQFWRNQNNILLIISSLSVIFLQLLFHGYFSLRYTDRGILSLVTAVASILLIVSISRKLSYAPFSFLAVIGRYSMSIYLIHILAGSGIRIVLSSFFGVEDLFLHLVIGCFAAIAFPIGVLRLAMLFQIPHLFSAPVSNFLDMAISRISFRK